MIDRYTIKFGPAVSQKELEKLLNEGADPQMLDRIHIEVTCDFDDLKKLTDFLKQLSKK
jgi:hypothetical protein